MNLQCERKFLHPRDALIGRSIEVFLPASVQTRQAGRRAGFQAAPAVRLMGSGRELFARRADDREFPVEIALSPLVLDGRRFVCAVVRDVTERHTAQIAVNRLAASIDSSEDAIIGTVGTPKCWRHVWRRGPPVPTRHRTPNNPTDVVGTLCDENHENNSEYSIPFRPESSKHPIVPRID